MGKKNKNKSTRKNNNARRVMKGFEELAKIFIEETTGGKKGGSYKNENPKFNNKRKFTKSDDGGVENTFKKDRKPFNNNRDEKKPFVKKRRPIFIHPIISAKDPNLGVGAGNADNKKYQFILEMDASKSGKLCTTEHTVIVSDEVTDGRLVALNEASPKPAIFVNELTEANEFNITSVIPVRPKNIIIDYFTRKTEEGREIICNILKVRDFIEKDNENGEKSTFACLAKYNSFKGFVETDENGEIFLNVQWKKEPFDGFDEIPWYIARKLMNPTVRISERIDRSKPYEPDVIDGSVDADENEEDESTLHAVNEVTEVCAKELDPSKDEPVERTESAE